MTREIGSEFWEMELKQESKPITNKQHQFLLTGRTALDYIVQNIKKSKNIKTVYMPSYCCHTMIQPFLDNGIWVKFYNISFKKGKFKYEIDFKTKCDIVLIMQYFGFYNDLVEQIIVKFKECGKLIIEDATHSWFSDIPYSHLSDYVFASFRKWTGLPCGAIAIKQNGSFSIKPPLSTNVKYVELRKQAASLKKLYIEKNEGLKEKFLGIFKEAEELLESDYKNYRMLEDFYITKLDTEKIKAKRKLNAKYLISELKNYKKVMCVESTGKDTPLFVPVIVGDGMRDELRKCLIKNDIYCPVHWPLSKVHKYNNKELYYNSLSLICDQRYTMTDMKRIVESINKFYGEGF